MRGLYKIQAQCPALLLLLALKLGFAFEKRERLHKKLRARITANTRTKNPFLGDSEAAIIAIEIPDNTYIALHATAKTHPSGVAADLLKSGYQCARESACIKDDTYPTKSPIAENKMAYKENFIFNSSKKNCRKINKRAGNWFEFCFYRI